VSTNSKAILAKSSVLKARLTQESLAQAAPVCSVVAQLVESMVQLARHFFFKAALNNDSMMILMSTCDAWAACKEVLSHGCSGPDQCFADLNGPARIDTHVNAVLMVATKQVVMQSAEDLEKPVTALGTHLASVPDLDKSEEGKRAPQQRSLLQ